MIITIAGRPHSELVEKAKKLASIYGFSYKERRGVSIETLKAHYQDDVVVFGKNRLFISPLQDDAHLFFHPNLALVRAKRVIKGEEEPLITTAKLREGLSFLDCTLGLASDSIIASLAVGSRGSIIGVEGNPLLYFLAKEGLSSFSSGIDSVDQAMRRIKVVNSDHYSFLKQAETDSVDVVYFDPMFHSGIDASNGINTIRGQAIATELTPNVIAEAKRVARECVVLKDHWKSERFTQLGFTQHKRKTSLFHYGTIELNQRNR